MGTPSKNSKKSKWSRIFRDVDIGFWNPWSYCNKRHEYVKSLRMDILGLGELHNKQLEEHYKEKRWIYSDRSELDDDGIDGMPSNSGNLPSMVERDEDGYLWAAAAEMPTLTEEESESEVDEARAEMYDSPSSMVHMGAPPPPPPTYPPPPYPPTRLMQNGEATTPTTGRVGELTPPPTLTDAGISPIER